MKFWEKLVAAFSLSAVMATVVVKMTDGPDEGVRLTSAAAARLNEAVKPEMFPPAMGHRFEDPSSPSNRMAHSNYMTFTREEGEMEERRANFMAGLRKEDCFTSESEDGMSPGNKSVCQRGLPELHRIIQERWREVTSHRGAVSVPELETIRDFSEKIARISGGDDGLSALGLAPGELSQKLCAAAQGELAFTQNAYNDMLREGNNENKDEYAQAVNVLTQKRDLYCSPR